MMSKQEVLEWVQSLPDDAEIGIDEGGLCLRVYEEGKDELDMEPWLEIGGLPLPEEES